MDKFLKPSASGKKDATKTKKGLVSNMKTVEGWKLDWINCERVKGKGLKITCKACSGAPGPIRARGAITVDPFTNGTFNVKKHAVFRHNNTAYHKASHGKFMKSNPIAFIFLHDLTSLFSVTW